MKAREPDTEALALCRGITQATRVTVAHLEVFGHVKLLDIFTLVAREVESLTADDINHPRVITFEADGHLHSCGVHLCHVPGGRGAEGERGGGEG